MSDPGKWLKDSFIQNMLELGAEDSSQLVDEADFLLSNWQSPNRIFHSLNHLRQMLDFLENLSENVHDPLILQIATWYHGIFTDVTEADDSEKRYQEFAAGAQRAQEQLPQLGLGMKQTNKVVDLILSLLDISKVHNDNDGIIFQDAAICYLGASPQEYREYRKMLREELSYLSDYQYAIFRGSFISRLLARDPLFKSSYGAELEENARHNLESELVNLAKLTNQSEKGDSRNDVLDTVERQEFFAGIPPITTSIPVLASKSGASMKQILNANDKEQPADDESVNEQHQSSMEMVEDILDTLSAKKPLVATGEIRRTASERGEKSRNRSAETAVKKGETGEKVTRKSILPDS